MTQVNTNAIISAHFKLRLSREQKMGLSFWVVHSGQNDHFLAHNKFQILFKFGLKKVDFFSDFGAKFSAHC